MRTLICTLFTICLVAPCFAQDLAPYVDGATSITKAQAVALGPILNASKVAVVKQITQIDETPGNITKMQERLRIMQAIRRLKKRLAIVDRQIQDVVVQREHLVREQNTLIQDRKFGLDMVADYNADIIEAIPTSMAYYADVLKATE